MFEVEHRIVVADSSFEQPLSIIGRRRNNHFNALGMEEPGLRAGGMEWTTLYAAAGRATNDYRHGHASAPVHLVRHVDDLIESGGNEVDELHPSDGTHTH